MLESIYRAASLARGTVHVAASGLVSGRIQVNRELIPENEVVRLVEELREQSSKFRPAFRGTVSEPAKAGTPNQDACPTFFEFVTVMALKFSLNRNAIW